MKINDMLADWPSGVVATQAWLHQHAVGSSLARKYQQSGWLERVGHGAWQRRGDKVDWQGGVFALQQQSPLSVWPGGQTALALQGYSHYLPLGGEEVILFGDPGSKLPGWFAQHEWGVTLRFVSAHLFSELDASAWHTYRPAYRQFELQISSLERAVLELIHVSEDESLFSAVAELLNGLATLSPRRLQRMLETCRSVRVKRVFLLLARHAGHVWYQRLDLTRIDLGKGKRQIVSGGRLDKQFLITVPERFADAH
ncbi:MAG TPA: type IV toxin-antitoxin system AbiEi family antitoxin domain-containing protein [Pseudomonas sp.]|nr:type IV toxin-antitoxin system AbiEi family antitoxin domain-containing protein [Pseudomonas sp.]